MKKLICYTLLLTLLVQVTACQSKTKEETASAEEASLHPGATAAIEPAIEAAPPQANTEPQAADDEYVTVKDRDTISISNYKLVFSPAIRTSFPAYYADQKERDRVTKDLDNSFMMAKAVENYLKTKHGHLFTAADSVLTLHLANGQTLRLPEWDGDEEDGIGYHLEHYFPEQDYFLLHAQYYEGNGWMLVNRKNGAKKYLHGRPYFSPDGTAVITANVEFYAYNYNGLEYYKVQADTLAEGWRLEIGNWGPDNIKWINNSEVLISKSVIDKSKSGADESMKIIESQSVSKLEFKEKKRL